MLLMLKCWFPTTTDTKLMKKSFSAKKMFSKISKNIYLIKQLNEEINIFKFKDFFFSFHGCYTRNKKWIISGCWTVQQLLFLVSKKILEFSFQKRPFQLLFGGLKHLLYENWVKDLIKNRWD